MFLNKNATESQAQQMELNRIRNYISRFSYILLLSTSP